MPETLLSEATLHLFGRVVIGLTLDPKGFAGTGTIARHLQNGKPTLARIYAFAFQNEYFTLASPALFVVDGPGTKVDQKKIDTTGLASNPPDITDDLLYWTRERGDMTIRLDIMTGTFDKVLLDYELADQGLQDFARGGKTLGQPTAGPGRARRNRFRPQDD